MREKLVIFCLWGPMWDWNEVMRQRDGEEDSWWNCRYQTVIGGVKHVKCKRFWQTIQTLRGLPSRLYTMQMVLWDFWETGSCISICSVLFYFTLCQSFCALILLEKSASNASSGIKFEQNLYNICNSTNPHSCGTVMSQGK